VSRLRSVRFWGLTVLALAAAVTTFSLGLWQWGRAHEKLALQAAVQAREALPPLEQDILRVTPRSPDLVHRQVVLRGQWLSAHTVYLDNRQMNGRVGFYVVTPLRLATRPGQGDDAVILVQRGWAPRNFSDRLQLPPVRTPEGEVTVTGRIAPAPSKLYDFDGAAAGAIRQNLDLAAFRSETGLPLLEGSVQQTGAPSEGLLREWPVPASSADKNYGYAFQWWALCGVIFILYVWFQFLTPGRRPAPKA
jgi:surfeit locus 1 family protein